MTTMVSYTQTQTISPPVGIQAAVGNTPLLPLKRVAEDVSPHVRIYAKAEWFNPSGSVKDRPALQIIRDAIRIGELTPGKRLLDSTSGNMGIAYATFGAAMGIPVTLTLPANASPERIQIMRSLGAELILTDPLEGSDGAMQAARELMQEYPERYFYANQYSNPANWHAHYQGTGPEIVQQSNGEVTHFIAGMGTSGTLTGATLYLQEYNPGIQSIAVQPDSPFHGLEGLKHIETAVQPGIYDPCMPDSIIEIPTETAHEMTRRLALEEGYFTGISAGAAATAAVQIARTLESGVIVTVFPDAGFKYLSDPELWETK